MLCAPVARDLGARRDPHAVLGGDVAEEAVEARGPSRAADDAAVQADVHQLSALLVELVESVDQVGREIVGGDEPVRDQELEVVGVERVRDHEVVDSVDVEPVRQLVGVGVGVVEEAALRYHELPGALPRPAGVPPDGPRAAQPLDRLDR